MKEKLFCVAITFKELTILPYDDENYKKSMYYCNIIDCKTTNEEGVSMLYLKFVDESKIYISMDNISSFQVDRMVEEDENDEVIEDIVKN